MKNKICLDMYVLTLIMLSMVALGFGIRAMMYKEPSQPKFSLDLRSDHLGSLQVR